MIVHQSHLISIAYQENKKLILPTWTGERLTPESFITEMKAVVGLLTKAKAERVIWDHTHFNFHIPDSLYPWIEENVNIPGKKLGLKKVGFILGDDVMAQFTTMDSFEATNSVYSPSYFSNPKKALDWAIKNDNDTLNPFEKEINFLIRKNIEKGTAKIQIEVDLELLPYYLKRAKELFNQQTYVHKNYQKYMLLTSREKEVLGLILRGYKSSAIAEILFISLHTVTTHRKHILSKLECKNIGELIRYKVFLNL